MRAHPRNWGGGGATLLQAARMCFTTPATGERQCMRGRIPKPTALKERQGNPGKRALNKGISTMKQGVARPPAHLSDAAKREWQRLRRKLAPAGLLTPLDANVLAMYCMAWARWVEAEEQLDAHWAGGQDEERQPHPEPVPGRGQPRHGADAALRTRAGHDASGAQPDSVARAASGAVTGGGALQGCEPDGGRVGFDASLRGRWAGEPDAGRGGGDS